jgi:hypothetical protein
MAGLSKTQVIVEFPDEFRELLGQINAAIQDSSFEIAGLIAEDAKASAAFIDYTGTPRESEWHKKHFPNARTLRDSIRAKKSKYEDGGAIVYASAPHAHLVERGHILVVHGKVKGSVPPHPFLGPAAQTRLEEAIEKFGKAIQGVLGS